MLLSEKTPRVTGSIDQSRSPGSRVIIGDDCLICGNISVESSNAEVIIGNNVFIGPNTSLVCSNAIYIDSDILISSDCLIQDSDNHSVDFEIRKKIWPTGKGIITTGASIPVCLSG